MKEKAIRWGKKFLKWFGIFWLVMILISFFVPQDIKDEVEQERLAKEAQKQAQEQEQVENTEPIEIDISNLSEEQKERYAEVLEQQRIAELPDYSSEMGVLGHQMIKNLLKSPSTADFPWDLGVNRIDQETYKQESYVDSQNSFGATVRTNFVVIMRYKEGEPLNPDSWDILNVSVDGERVF